MFVVEHAIDVIEHADWVVDVGPAAGEHGGRILYSGPLAGLRAVEAFAQEAGVSVFTVYRYLRERRTEPETKADAESGPLDHKERQAKNLG